MIPIPATDGLFGLQREEAIRLAAVAAGTLVASALLAQAARVFRSRGIAGAGLLLFAALVYAPLLGFYVFLATAGWDRPVLNPLDVAGGAEPILGGQHPPARVLLFLVLVLGAYIGVSLLDGLLFSREREIRLGWRVPRILRDTARWTVLVLFALGVGGYIFQFRWEGIAIFGGTLTIAVSLALGPTLGALVSGFTLTAERPFELGDWIEVDGRQGRVDQITWRATRIVTRDNETVIYPNSVLATVRIVNHSRPGPVLGVRCQVDTHIRSAPLDVRAVLARVLDGTPGVLRSPQTAIRVLRFHEGVATWEIRFWIEDVRAMEDIKADVLHRIWYALRRADVEIAAPTRNLLLRDRAWEGPPVEDPRARRARVHAGVELLRRVPVFGTLPDAVLERLADAAPVETFLPGEVITVQGEPGDRMFILESGQARVTVQVQGDGEGARELSVLGPGEFFGEMSLLTGCPRVASVTALGVVRAFCVRAAELAPILRETPGFAQAMATFAAERKIRLDELARKAEVEQESADLGQTTGHLLRDIMHFFGLHHGPRGNGRT